MGVQNRNVPHFRGLICAKVDLEAEVHESTFTFCYAQLKKAILHHKRASGRFILSSTVHNFEASNVRDKKFQHVMVFMSVLSEKS